MTRAATTPVSALEAWDLMGETPRGQNARDVEHAEQRPDQKAKEIVKKALTRIWNRRCPRTCKGLRPRSSNPPLDWFAQEGDIITLHSNFNKFKEGTCLLESNLFRFQSQRSWTTKLERSNAERWYLILMARGETWKQGFVTSSRKRHWQLMRRWRTTKWKNWRKLRTENRSWKNALRVSRRAIPQIRHWRSLDCRKDCSIQGSKQHWPVRKRRC